MTRLISESIFENEIPSLLQSSSRNFFSTELEMNEETFRLSLLWNDLTTKLRSGQPFWAILGLLDVANVLPQKATVELYNSIRKDIMDAVLIAPDSMPTVDSLNFITSLLSRHKRKLMDREILHLVHRSVKKIAQNDVQKAIDFLENYPNPISRIPSSVYAGIADGISIPLRNIEESGYIHNLTIPEIGLQLLSTSQEFAEIAVYFFEKNQPIWKNFLRTVFAAQGDTSKSRAAKKIATVISKNTSLELIDLLLNNSSERTYKSVVNKFTLKNIIDNERFVTPIYLNASRLNLIDYLLDLLFTSGNQTFAGLVIIKLLSQRPESLSEFLLDERLNINTAAYIIDAIFTDPTEEFVGLLKTSRNRSEYLINSPVSDHISKFATANILTYANIPIESSLYRLNKLPSDAINSINSYNLTTFLAKAMRELNTEYDSSLKSLLSKIKKINVSYLYEAAIHHNNVPKRIIGNLEIILNDLRFTNKVIENIDYVSRVLEGNLAGLSSPSILNCWARTLSQSGKYKDLQKQAAVYMLQYAYRKAQNDPTELIEVAFPIIYKAFLKGKSITTAINHFLFPDWDKCKTLREELVEIYFKKNWSKFGLLSVAITADILKEVLKIINHKANARNFFDQALQEASQSPKRNQILKAISKLKD